ncbi:metal-dependent hydrolase family protein [Endozoicomonas montiporae]|uniref:Amidohydrolase n=1 Tax=Endozoicomonas montiporae CL-33 TaxID=570277 RepID=A0A142BCQ6_9GAMM|nr:amidohydrolase family protein [Endozoicomonas montiporae]AMO56532.1 amidohydrolase [Endozoicomonas montiporae CL-33]
MGSDLPGQAADSIQDIEGRIVMPGLCDAHVHITAATPDFVALRHWSPSYVAAHAKHILKGMLMRGFTTVRDAGGADFGYVRAIEEGLLIGPRLLFCGHALSQTGGHGDMRVAGDHQTDHCFCCAGLGKVCDGVSEVRRACRDEIRKGAHQIKLMVSGGVASPTDRITSTQFSKDEIEAAVAEAEAANIYVMAHAYTNRAIVRALKSGVRSIEHGNLIGQEGIELLKQKQAFLVPTLSTYDQLAEKGIAAGMPEALQQKVFSVLDAGIQALEAAWNAKANIVFGTDLLGSMHDAQLKEFALRSEVIPAVGLIQSATIKAAELFMLSDEIGQIAPGYRADLLVLQENPLDDIRVLQHPEKYLKMVMKDGVIYKNEL